MEYRNLGRSGLKVSPICLGTMLFGGAIEAERAEPLFHIACERIEIHCIDGGPPPIARQIDGDRTKAGRRKARLLRLPDPRPAADAVQEHDRLAGWRTSPVQVIDHGRAHAIRC